MASAQYEIKIGWERNTDFEGLYDDITSDVKSIHFSRGKSDELGKAEVGQCSIIVKNTNAKYSPSNSSSVLAGNLLPKRPVRIRAIQQLLSVSVTKALTAASDYAAEDVLSESASAGTAWTFSDITKLKGGFGYIIKAQVICQTTGLTPKLSLYLFKATPTSNLNDNVANTTVLHADLDSYIGKIDFPAMEDLGGDSESIATPSTYGNLPLGFSCALNSISIYGVLVTRDAITNESAGMSMTINLIAELPQYDLFYGFIEEIIPHPHLTEQDCVITAVDGLDFLSRHDMATELYKGVYTGIIQSYILDDALWNQDMRLLDAGQDTIPYWYGHDVKARFAQEEIDDSEQGFSYIDGAGHFNFEDRHHRSTAIHQTSQGTFDDTMANITYSLNPKNVYNIIKSTVTPWALGTGDSDIGSAAIDRPAFLLSGYTAIDLANPANNTGTITSVEVWANTNMTGFRVGTFYWVSGSTYKCRDSEIIGAVTAGSKQTFAVSLDIVVGDFIGCYYATGRIEKDNTGGSGLLLYSGEAIDALDEASYTLNSDIIISLYGTGNGNVITELWKLQEIPSIPAGETSTWWGESSVSGASVFVDAWTTPVSTTDYMANSQANGLGTDLTSSITLTATKFAKTIKLQLQNTAAVPAFITLLKARGTYYDDQTKVTRKAEDSTSQNAYQKRTLEIDGKYMTDADEANDFVNYAIGKYKDPRSQLSMTVMNQDDTTLTQILSREISDRITVINTNLGLNDDYLIDHMEHAISISGLLHTATYHLADTINEDFWCLDYSALASSSSSGQTKLGY